MKQVAYIAAAYNLIEVLRRLVDVTAPTTRKAPASCAVRLPPGIGADTVNPQAGVVAANDTLFDECAGSLQASTGAYGYRVMPPCLYGGSSPVPEVR